MNRTKSFARFAASTAVAIGILTLATPADAYRMLQNTDTGRVIRGVRVPCDDPGGFVHWNTRAINVHHNTSGQGSGKTAALYNAMNVWTMVPDANHVVTYAGETTAGWATDGINTILWATGNGCTDDCLALTALVLQSGQVIVETDITFNANETWRTDGSDYDTQAVAAHELGHSLGIHHSNVWFWWLRPTMWATYFGTDARSLTIDDIAALQCAEDEYPRSPSCVPEGGVDDTLSQTSCCSGYAVSGSTYCLDPGDWGTSWASCHHICGTRPVGGCIPSGGIDDTLHNTRCCSGRAVSGSTRCLDPADYGTDWKTCIQTCQ